MAARKHVRSRVLAVVRHRNVVHHINVAVDIADASEAAVVNRGRAADPDAALAAIVLGRHHAPKVDRVLVIADVAVAATPDRAAVVILLLVTLDPDFWVQEMPHLLAVASAFSV